MTPGTHTARQLLLALAAALAAAAGANAQQIHLDRLSAERLDVAPPAERVTGEPGRMRVVERACRTMPADELRRRIIDIAVQEWGFFGFSVLDQMDDDDDDDSQPRRRAPRTLAQQREAARVADSIAGYWAVTDDGGWILERQNDVWQGPYGDGARWRDPWSAAFISWVMCEGDVGEMPIEPGDLLCSARRSAYLSIGQRRGDLGEGVRTHCDITIRVEEHNGRVLVIGGNVSGSVRMKLFAANFDANGDGESTVRWVGGDGRTIFAHLKLRADPIDADALDTSPTVQALVESGDDLGWLRQRLAGDRPVRAAPVAATAGTPGVPTPAL